jgi:sulfite exporter TauE/SafE
MICYNHPDRPAVGTCKHCHRGLCKECAVLVDDSVACRDRHEQQVASANLAMARTVLQAQRTGAGYMRSAVFYGLAGGAFAALGLIQYRFLGLQAVFFILIGLFLLYAGIANFLEARRYR